MTIINYKWGKGISKSKFNSSALVSLSPIKLRLSIYNRLLSDTTTSCSVSGENSSYNTEKISSIIKAIQRENTFYCTYKYIL